MMQVRPSCIAKHNRSILHLFSPSSVNSLPVLKYYLPRLCHPHIVPFAHTPWYSVAVAPRCNVLCSHVVSSFTQQHVSVKHFLSLLLHHAKNKHFYQSNAQAYSLTTPNDNGICAGKRCANQVVPTKLHGSNHVHVAHVPHIQCSVR